ncbi:MAG: restriction endonuclease subunit M [Saprospiraceae bacterium]|nr:restriction endonuclease subunit M [Candidatus Vicinibacter affinis]
MNTSTKNIDILENTLLRTGNLLDILLTDRTTKKNILWATDSYEKYGKEFSPKLRIKPALVTGKFGLLIQPRAVKSFEEQRRRTKDKAEVFTPLKTVNQINKSVENRLININNWQEYIHEIKLEITCGEAPFIVSRYSPTLHTRKFIDLNKRVGFLDKKLKVVSKYCKVKKEWIFWAKEAFKASYGYDWQGDNVLIARENLLYTFIDYYKEKFKLQPTLKTKEELAEIISWNIFQMDGLKYVVPMSCHHETRVIPGEQTLFEKIPDRVEINECEGCKYNRPNKHNGMYVNIMDWSKNKIIRFADLIK